MSDPTPLPVRIICDAYEAGFGDGMNGANKLSAYEPWSDGWYAYAYGVWKGIDKRQSSEEPPCPNP